MKAFNLLDALPYRWRVRFLTWEDDLDVAGGVPRAAWWSWGLLAVGTLALMVAVDHVDHLRQQQDEVSADVRRLRHADRQMRLQRAVALKARDDAAGAATVTANHTKTTVTVHDAGPGAALPAAPALQGPAVQGVWRMARLLAYPWAAHLAWVDQEAASAQVVLMQMSVLLDSAEARLPASGEAAGANRVGWRLQAVAKDDASAWAWVRHLPQGEVLSREPASAPFTTRAGTYAVNLSVAMHAPVSPAVALPARSAP